MRRSGNTYIAMSRNKEYAWRILMSGKCSTHGKTGLSVITYAPSSGSATRNDTNQTRAIMSLACSLDKAGEKGMHIAL